MGAIRVKSGRWNCVSGGADDDHKSDCNDYELKNMLGVSALYDQNTLFFTIIVIVSKLLTIIMIILPICGSFPYL